MNYCARTLVVVLALGSVAACVRRAAPSGSRTGPDPLELQLVVLVPHDTLPTGLLRGRLSSNYPGSYYPPTSVAGASIELPDAGLSTRADSGGAFELRGVPPGRQRLHVRRLGFEPTRGSVHVPASGGAVLRVLIEVQMLCLDYCPPEPPRAFGRIESVPNAADRCAAYGSL